MIKLIASDIDGTLIQDSTPDLYPEAEREIVRLTDQGVLFAGTSGRQYASIRNVFRNVADRIIYIAENGAVIRYRDKTLALTTMDRKTAEELVEQLRRDFSDCDLVLSTPEGSRVEKKKDSFLDMLINGYHNKVELVKDVLDTKLPVVKVSMFYPGSIRERGERDLIPVWRDRLGVCVAGEEWVDFMDRSVDKGNALRTVQRLFHIAPEETMAFGDNTNDLGLMRAAGESYAVENAHPSVKEAAKYICPSWREKGVWQVLRRLP
ncbi:MAG: HAD family hydrolase [Eubacteriales bacterium]|nr:HAD family hydrolase [Eubacteriales bacterium]